MATAKKTPARPTTTRQRNAVGTARAKQPQDRKPKAPPKPKEIEGDLVATVRDVEWKIPAENFDDFELMGWLHEADAGHPELMPSILIRLLGEEQNLKAMNMLRGPNGRVSAEAGIAFLQEIFEVFNPNS